MVVTQVVRITGMVTGQLHQLLVLQEMLGSDFKSNHYRGWSADDVLIMQGFTASGDPYGSSLDVGYINGCFTNRGGNMYNMFRDHISLANHSNIGGTD